MKLGIIQLSDIHINNENDMIINNVSKVVDSIKNKCYCLDKIILLITGDICFSGTSDQYEVAYCFISDIVESLEKYINKKINVFIAPGNHVCNFDNNNGARAAIIKQVLIDGKVDESIAECCCIVQKEYNEFLNLFNDKSSTCVFKDNLVRIYKIDNLKKDIYFIMLNTSWISQKKEKTGEMYFPIDNYENEINKCLDGLVITFFHHPSKWNNPIVSNYLDNKIESFSDFIFEGHEHISQKYEKCSDNNHCVYIRGNALQDDRNPGKSEFDFVIIDMDQGVYNYQVLSFDNGNYIKIKDSEWVDYKEIIENKKEKFKLKNETLKIINDIGFNLSHPRKDRLVLKDIFVYPYLEEIEIENMRDGSYKEVQINSKQLLDLLDEHPAIIYGDEKYGKTSLARMLYLESLKKGDCPVYVNGSDIKHKFVENSQKLIEKCFDNQYCNDSKIEFDQLDYRSKLIIVDDFDKINIPIRLREKLLSNLFTMYPNTIIFGSNLLELQDFISADNESILKKNVKQYRLKKFGYGLRNDLIHKWNILGNEQYEGDNEIIVKDEETFRRMNILIGKNYIPSVPFYLLIILQAFEMDNENNFNDSAYGYYYEFLILQTLNKISSKQGDKEAYISFMVKLAHKFYSDDNKNISLDDLQSFHTKFCEDYRVSKTFKNFVNFDKFINDMCEANMLICRYNNFEFSYRYIYYYSIGKYFGDNIYRQEIQEELIRIIEKIQNEEFANIVMFIIHHTKNEFVLGELIRVAKNIFSDHKCIRLEHDILFINELQEELPKIIIDKKIDVEKSRKKKLEKLDKETEEKNSYVEIAADTNKNDDSSALEKIKLINLSFKTMEILGQILKNYWGSLNGNIRCLIGKEIYLLGLRTLDEIYETFKEAKDKILGLVDEQIKEGKITDIKKIEKKVRSMLFLFASYFTLSCIDKISECIGDDKLSETFKDIETDLDYNSVKIINLSIQLEYYGGAFPFSYAESLLKDNKNNIMPEFLIKHMIKNYLYMYKTSVSNKNRIAELAQIDVKDIDLNNVKQELRTK